MSTPSFSTEDDLLSLDDAVEVRTTAAAKHLSAVRAVAADLAMRQDFDLDTVADLRLAVDEACSSLVQLAVKGSTLRVAFLVGSESLRMVASVRSATDTVPATGTFSWQVLDTLADDVRSDVRPVGEEFEICIELVKHKGGR